jgi:release factor glutamine methyltransferase
MPTVLEILNKTTAFLEQKGVSEARFNTECLLAHGLKMPRMQLYLNFDRPLAEAELETLRPLVGRRAKREPLQHILGSTGFRFLELKCDARALIPRPDTETLVECALEAMQRLSDSGATRALDHMDVSAESTDVVHFDSVAQLSSTENALGDSQKSTPKDALKLLDIGTGTGAVLLSLLNEKPGHQGVGLDYSLDALALALENAGLNQVTGVQFVQGDALANQNWSEQPWWPAGGFDLIVSNPPYIPTQDCTVLEPEVRDFDPRLALDGGVDGLVFYREFCLRAAQWLAPQGELWVEIGYDQGDSVPALDAPGLECLGVRKDLGGQPRCVGWRRV